MALTTGTVERARARVDLAALERNCRRLRELLSPGTALCAVVKADGYGHGMLPAAGAARSGGAAWLATATAAEAAELRAAGVDGPVLVQGALTPADLRLALAARADVVVSGEEFTRRVAEEAESRGVVARVHVKLDTGMGRLGTRDPEEARRALELAAAEPALQPVGAMTHFATADEPGDEHFPRQLERFGAFVQAARGAAPDLLVHAANSAATFRDPASHFDMVRCGVAIYGLDPFQGDPAERGLEPVLSLETYVAAVKRFEAGASAGYGRTWTAPRTTLVGVLPIGYGDGWRRGLSNRAEVLIEGRRRPLVGTVSMDNVTVDLGPDAEVTVGSPAVLIGAQGEERILSEEVARQLGTINYEVTCGLLPRVRRAYEPA
jgi:alanine racemase